MDIEIEVFYHSNETLALDNVEVKFSLLECDTRVMTFYTINAIAPYLDEESNQWFCDVYSNAKTFIATKTYEEIKNILKRW